MKKHEYNLKKKIFWIMEDGEGWFVEPIKDEEGNIVPECVVSITLQDLIEILEKRLVTGFCSLEVEKEFDNLILQLKGWIGEELKSQVEKKCQ